MVQSDNELVREFLQRTARLTDTEAGQLVGASQPTVSRWKKQVEEDGVTLSVRYRRALEQYLRVPDRGADKFTEGVRFATGQMLMAVAAISKSVGVPEVDPESSEDVRELAEGLLEALGATQRAAGRVGKREKMDQRQRQVEALAEQELAEGKTKRRA